MITVRNAIQIILEQVTPGAIRRVPLEEAAGKVLAHDVRSDVDMPPFDKSFVDGYALRAEDVLEVPAELHVVGTVPAGTVPDFELGAGQAAKVMTGAPVPKGTNAVQMVEHTIDLPDQDRVRILESVGKGKNVAPRGSDVQVGDVVLRAGSLITPAAVGVLASVGCTDVDVFPALEISILTTGNELVGCSEQPQPGQIRNSNGPMLAAQVREVGCLPRLLGTAADEVAVLEKMVAEGLESDVLLVTGGVSMGDLDLVEGVFARLGVQPFFDKVAIKPGKPTVFGRRGETLVFGLPGNPVSAQTVFEILVRPALRKRMGFTNLHLPRARASLVEGFRHRSGREDYHPAWTRLEGDRFVVQALPTHGSADLVAFARSNSFLVISREVDRLEAGSEAEVVLRKDFWQTQP